MKKCLTDDRLADVLRLLSDDVHWRAFEQELMGQLLRVYDLSASCVRIDTTTASSYAQVSEEGLLQLGHSKDHRPDLPQLKLVLASLDPLGMPLANGMPSSSSELTGSLRPHTTRVGTLMNGRRRSVL